MPQNPCSAGPPGCASCHRPHGSANEGLLVAPSRDLCATCHADVTGWKARKVQHAPFAQGRCAACHDPHASDDAGLLTKGGAALCGSCHKLDASLRAVHKGYPVEKAACHQCHDPHASARKALFREGAVESFLYDLKTAALMGVESTGNGTRSLFSLPSPSASNLVLEAGETPLETMIAGISHGLFVDSLLGLGQGNPLSGAFSNPVGLAYVIEDGQIVGRVKDLTLAGNVYDLLKTVEDLSRERTWVHGRYLLPHILMPELDVVRSR